MLPEIRIDGAKCTTARSCGICLTSCPQAVLKIRPVKLDKWRETPPDGYIIRGDWPAACTGCLDCEKVCPTGAISVTYHGRSVR